jgi:hypothetical protein
MGAPWRTLIVSMPSPLEHTDPPFMIFDPLMIDIATLGEEPEMTLETLGHHIEVAPCLDGLGTHAFFEPLKPPINVREPLVDLGEPLVDFVEPLVDFVEPLVDFVEPLVHLVEPRVDFGEARIDLDEALVDVSLQLPDRHVGRVFVGHPTIVLRELCPGRSERKRGGFVRPTSQW